MDNFEKEVKANKFIKKLLEKSLEKLVLDLQEKYDYNFSEGSLLGLYVLTDDFIQKLTREINNSKLMEPEDFPVINRENVI